MKRILSLEDLCLFCEQNKMNEFEAANDTVLAVNIPASFSSTREIDTVGLVPVTIKTCHDDINRKKSNIDVKVLEEAMDSFKNRPILAEIIENKDGDFDFGGHAFHKDKDGNVIYTEHPVGIVPESCNPRIEYDEDKKKNYLYVDGYIYEDYGNQTMEILDRRNGSVDVSVEIGIMKFSYNAKKKVLNIEEFTFLGVTLLGEEATPAMKGANLQVTDFALNISNSVYSTSNTNANNFEKGGLEMNKEKISELMAKYSLSELPFSEEELTGKSNTELESMFADKFEEKSEDKEDKEDSEDEKSEEKTDEPIEEKTPSEDEDPEEEKEDPELPKEDKKEEEESKTDDDEDEDEDGEDEEEIEDSYSITIKGKTSTYSLPVNEKIRDLSELVNHVYEEDRTYYSVLVYDNELVMIDCWGSCLRGYRQGYAQNEKGCYELIGERVEVIATWLTTEEQAEAEKIRSEYDKQVEKEIQSEKDEILNDEAYSVMSDSSEWKELIKNAKEYSVDELSVRAAALYGNYCKTQTQKSAVRFSLKRGNRKTPYGSLF